MTPLPRAVLLDLDDTILDDSGNITMCWLTACHAHRSAMNGLDPVSVHDAIERVREWYWADPDRHRKGRLDLVMARREVVQLALAEIGVDNADLARQIGDTYHDLRDTGLRPFADALDTVRWLRSSGCRLALLTNGSEPMQRAKVNRFGLVDLFDAIFIEGELGFGKPDPRVYMRALETLDVAAGDSWMVGDNLEWDVAQPQRQGIYGVWIDLRGQGVPGRSTVRPDHIIRRLSDLRDLVREER